jgi:hypothetical protein
VRILAVDPGGNTGLARWADGNWEAWFEDAQTAASQVHAELVAGLDALVFESFRISAQTAKKTQTGSLEAIELIGIGRYLARQYGTRFVLQSPAEAKIFATDEKLKALGMWTKGVDHPRDATRHLLLFLAKERLFDVKKLIPEVI